MPNRLGSNDWNELQEFKEEVRRQNDKTEERLKDQSRQLEEFKKEVREDYVTKDSLELSYGWANKFKAWGLALVGGAFLLAVLKLIIK